MESNGYSALLYNTLLSVEEADFMFDNREEILSKLAPLLAKYDNQFGVCLVHRHSDLEDGEMMVTRGDTSEPEKAAECHPERWLVTGVPYEFSSEPTPSPPEGLLKEFQYIVKGLGILGLAYLPKNTQLEPGDLYSEHTEGRKNIMKISKAHTVGTITTCWAPNNYKEMLPHMVCEQKDGHHTVIAPGPPPLLGNCNAIIEKVVPFLDSQNGIDPQSGNEQPFYSSHGMRPNHQHVVFPTSQHITMA